MAKGLFLTLEFSLCAASVWLLNNVIDNQFQILVRYMIYMNTGSLSKEHMLKH